MGWSARISATRRCPATRVFFKDRWINPFLASGASQTVIDEFNGDNFDHSNLGFLGGGYIYANVTNGRPITSRAVPPGTPKWGSTWKKANADWYAHNFTISAHGSWYPHRENYVDLDPTYVDAYGQPLLRMTFDVRENERKMSVYLSKKDRRDCQGNRRGHCAADGAPQGTLR